MTANRKGRWRARLHVVVPPRRATVVVVGRLPGRRPGDDGGPARAAGVTPGAPELVMIGDSLAQGTAPYLPELLPGWRVTADAARSRFLFTGMVVRDTMRKPPSRPVVLAFSLFTNDDPSRAPDLEAAVRALARRPAPRVVRAVGDDRAAEGRRRLLRGGQPHARGARRRAAGRHRRPVGEGGATPPASGCARTASTRPTRATAPAPSSTRRPRRPARSHRGRRRRRQARQGSATRGRTASSC